MDSNVQKTSVLLHMSVLILFYSKIKPSHQSELLLLKIRNGNKPVSYTKQVLNVSFTNTYTWLQY